MSLDLTKTALQIDQMAQHLKSHQGEKQRRIQNSIEAVRSLDVGSYEQKRQLSNATMNWRTPSLLTVPTEYRAAPAVPNEFCVVAVDGSHIEIDRHIPARCFLINIGVAVLRYGAQSDASLSSYPTLYAADDDLVIRDTVVPYRQQNIDGALLGAKRTVEEIKGLARTVRDLPDNVPCVGLVDGSLLMFGLDGQHYQEFVKRQIIEEGFIGVLEELRQLSTERPFALASYISLPRSTEVINALRLQVCPYDVADCDRFCGHLANETRPCETKVGGLMDRELFGRELGYGERTGLFGSASPLVQTYYKGHEVCFFYVNTGEEIGRVEVPLWVAENSEMLDMVHAFIVDQSRRGPGYPVALMEAHEQAVVTGSDRMYFVQLVEEALYDQRLSVYTSEKSMSKRVRWL